MMKRGCIFTVSGTDRFPFDMLRYDRCFPQSDLDASRIALRDLPCSRVVTLVSDTLNAPTIERWRSFGWIVQGSRRL